MISQIKKTEITIYNTQRGEGAAELKRIAALRGLDIVANGNDWLIGDNMGKITYNFDGESFWYTMVLMNEALEESAQTPSPLATTEKSLNEELADLTVAFVKTGKIDARKISKEAKEWALKRQWLVRDGKSIHFADYRDHRYFLSRYDLPEEVILILMQRDGVFKDSNSIGFSITKKHFWELLDIYPNGSRWFDENAIREMEQVLMRLDTAGLITFMSSGKIWSIYKKD